MPEARGWTIDAVASPLEGMLACGASTSAMGAVVGAIVEVTTWGTLAWATSVGGLRGGSAARVRALAGSASADGSAACAALAIDLVGPVLRSSTGAGGCRRTVSWFQRPLNHPPWLGCEFDGLRAPSLALEAFPRLALLCAVDALAAATT
jgi:hypothetical protein